MAMRQRVRGAFLVGILWVTFIAWIPGHAASYLGSGSAIPGDCAAGPLLMLCLLVLTVSQLCLTLLVVFLVLWETLNDDRCARPLCRWR